MAKYQFLKPPEQSIEEIIEILKGIRKKITESTDVVEAKPDSIKELLLVIDANLEELIQGNITTLKTSYYHFAPTSTLQELALANGWGDKCVSLLSRFDTLCEGRGDWR